MASTHSFAPFAARLAAHSAALRPVAGGREGLGHAVMATVWRLLLEFLICLCEALDARAAAEAALASGVVEMAVIPAPRAARPAVPGEMRAPRLTLLPQAQVTTLSQAVAPSGIIGHPPLTVPRLAWSRNPGPMRVVLAPPWRPRRETRLLRPDSSTLILLRFCN